MSGDLPETHEADQKPAEPKGNALERLMARLLERKPILYLVFIFTIIGALVSVAASVVGILAFVKDQADDRPSPRLRSAAYRLGDDVFPAAFAGELDLGTAERETVADIYSRVRSNLTALGINVKFPPEGKDPARFVAVLHEEIRPRLVSKDNELLDWYDYGFYWSGKDMGLALISTYMGPKGSAEKSETAKAMSGLLADQKDDYAAAEELEQRLDLPRTLKRQARDIRGHIDEITDVYMIQKMEDVQKEIQTYTKAVIQHIES